MKIYKAGGCLRDEYMGLPIKDWDFAVELDRSHGTIEDNFKYMVGALQDSGYTIFVSTPEFVTVRAHFPRGHEQFGKTTADFVLCRKDGFSSDNRRPDEVFVGTLWDDLARRDFTCNAMAQRMGTDEIIDPFHGRDDIDNKLLRFVGNPMTRIREDALRALRGLRFTITKGFEFDGSSALAIYSEETAELLSAVDIQRVRDELLKMFRHNSLDSMTLLGAIPHWTKDAIFRDNKIKLLPALGRKIAAFDDESDEEQVRMKWWWNHV